MQGPLVFTLGFILYILSFFKPQYFIQFSVLGSFLLAVSIYVWLYVQTIEPIVGNMRKYVESMRDYMGRIEKMISDK